MLKPGIIATRPKPGSSQAYGRVHPLSPLTSTQKFQPLPTPLGQPPYHFDLESAVPGITAHSAQIGKLVFHAVGDTGGVKNPSPQIAVADAMVTDLGNADPAKAPSFFYHVGDVVYFNGQVTEYYNQFYEPYAHYTPPIIAIPGNHDGDPINSSQVSLDGWVRYFMTPAPVVNPESHDAPRTTLSLPNVYYTLTCPFVTIVGMYTNVPEHGSIDSVQQQWLTNELATAPTNRALILALHHPIYSFDAYHSGSPTMAAAVEQAINSSRRVPNMFFTAHVHNYQRIEKSLFSGSTSPFLVIGNGGYYNLHKLTVTNGATDPATGATMVIGDDAHHGYSTITVDAENISGVATTVANSKDNGNPALDTFSYPVAAINLPDGVNITL